MLPESMEELYRGTFRDYKNCKVQCLKSQMGVWEVDISNRELLFTDGQLTFSIRPKDGCFKYRWPHGEKWFPSKKYRRGLF